MLVNAVYNHYLLVFGPDAENISVENVALPEWSFDLYRASKKNFEGM